MIAGVSMTGLTVKKIRIVETEDIGDKDELMWGILEEARPCEFRCRTDKIAYCEALNCILHEGINPNKAKITPNDCANCEFSDKKRKK
jgi:hypothetical protein